MKIKYSIIFGLIIIFAILVYIYHSFSFGKSVDTVFLTISTFLFAILTGFFIARQSTRYSRIREEIANFDGNISSIYRTFGHLGQEAQSKVARIIGNHYKPIIENNQWDYHFTHKTTTFTDIHEELENAINDKTVVGILSGITLSLRDNQLIRKKLVALHKERMPKFQWFLVYVLSIILLITLSMLPSQGIFLNTILKSIFAVIIITFIILLHQLDKLKLFEGIIGENSAQDVLDILAGKK